MTSNDELNNMQTTKEEPVTPIPGYKSVEDFVQNGFKVLIDGTKNANRLPSGKSRDFYEACPAFHRIMREQGDAVLTQLTRVMRHAGGKGNIQRRDDEERMEMVVDVNDTIFERVGTLLDDIAGIRRNPDAEFITKSNLSPISGSWNKRALAAQPSNKQITAAMSVMLNASKNMEKPQLQFADKVDNARDTPFVPRINYKHNMLKPLAILFEDDENGGQYSHPYEFELDKWEPPERLLVISEPILYLPLTDTPLLHVTTPDKVQEMLEHLRKVNEIAIDLEHHSYRTFQGVTCLMQISTRERDFIVDTIALRGDLQCLNEVLTDPHKLKVFHGAQSDIQWLQRDLALYVVNMFDTHIAARLLNYSALSLAYLLNRFCDVRALKQFQLADWRIRPLPNEMIQYAREDTHYLLYIYDMLRNQLIETANGQHNLLRAVFSESSQLCRTRYVKPTWQPEDHLVLYHKSKRLFDNRQLFALQQLCDWRDKTAREFDESIGYVLPNHMLLHIAETLPREVQGILACCNPVPPLVRQHLTPLHLIIRKAREQPLVRPVVDQTRQINRAEVYGLSFDSPLNCPHDLTWLPEFRPDLPTLLTTVTTIAESHDLDTVCPTVSLFEAGFNTKRKVNRTKLLTPYQRYKLAKPYADQIGINVNKDVENTDSSHKMDIDQVQKLIKIERAPLEEPTPLRKQLKPGEYKNKNRSGCLEEVPKKRKKKPGPIEEPYGVITEVDPQPEKLAARLPSEVPPKEKKKKKKKPQPDISLSKFDYSSVDFGKFQSSSAEKLAPKEARSKTKHKRKGGKKFKISI